MSVTPTTALPLALPPSPATVALDWLLADLVNGSLADVLAAEALRAPPASHGRPLRISLPQQPEQPVGPRRPAKRPRPPQRPGIRGARRCGRRSSKRPGRLVPFPSCFFEEGDLR